MGCKYFICVSLTKCPLKSVFALWDKWFAMPLYIWLYGRKGNYCPRQVQTWAFKMKITPAVSSYFGI